ncbi:MAG TPA: SMP-30/gluconolactonase/LRE family protein, partial [Mycobacteriales bacterium]|nr:SMP-30/gluconolactonase/LRE family protein [Mycobacteriales bacterium]
MDVTLTVHEPLSFEVLAEGLGFPEGPVFAADGAALVVDIDGGRIVRVADGVQTVVATPGGGPNGMALDTPTTAIVANNGGFLWSAVGGLRIPIDHATHTNEPPGFEGGWIERVNLATGTVDVLFRDCGGRPLRGPNDLVIDDAGGIWFTDHGKG